MTATQFVPRRPRSTEELSKGDGIWIVTRFNDDVKRKRARVFDVLRRAAVLEEIEGRGSERQTVPFDQLELMDPAEMHPSAPAHREWLKQQERAKKTGEENARRDERRDERRNAPPPPPPVMPALPRRTVISGPLRAVPAALENVASAVQAVPPPKVNRPAPTMLSWAEDGLKLNIETAHQLEDRIAEIDGEIEQLKATIADKIAQLEAKKKVESDRLAQTRLMIETIEAQINTMKAG